MFIVIIIEILATAERFSGCGNNFVGSIHICCCWWCPMSPFHFHLYRHCYISRVRTSVSSCVCVDQRVVWSHLTIAKFMYRTHHQHSDFRLCVLVKQNWLATNLMQRLPTGSAIKWSREDEREKRTFFARIVYPPYVCLSRCFVRCPFVTLSHLVWLIVFQVHRESGSVFTGKTFVHVVIILTCEWLLLKLA